MPNFTVVTCSTCVIGEASTLQVSPSGQPLHRCLPTWRNGRQLPCCTGEQSGSILRWRTPAVHVVMKHFLEPHSSIPGGHVQRLRCYTRPASLPHTMISRPVLRQPGGEGGDQFTHTGPLNGRVDKQINVFALEQNQTSVQPTVQVAKGVVHCLSQVAGRAVRGVRTGLDFS